MLLYALFLSLAPGTPVSSANEDCDIVAAVARKQHGLGKRIGPPLRDGAGFLPACNWASLGVQGFATAGQRPRSWVIFHKPEIRGRTSSVVTAIVWGPRSGHNSRCTLRKIGGRWRLQQCRTRAVS